MWNNFVQFGLIWRPKQDLHCGHSKSKKLFSVRVYFALVPVNHNISTMHWHSNNYLQITFISLSNMEPVYQLLPPWQVSPNWGRTHYGLAPTSNRWRHTSSTIGISESDLIKIIISFWPRGHYNQLVCVGQQARRGSDDLRVIWHNSNTYYPHTNRLQ